MTLIPFYCVDAVVEVPYGSHPGSMPYLYYSDEEHVAQWLRMSKTEMGTAAYFDRYVYGVKDFGEYLELVGGQEKMARLKEIELLKAQTTTLWAR